MLDVPGPPNLERSSSAATKEEIRVSRSHVRQLVPVPLKRSKTDTFVASSTPISRSGLGTACEKPTLDSVSFMPSELRPRRDTSGTSNMNMDGARVRDLPTHPRLLMGKVESDRSTQSTQFQARQTKEHALKGSFRYKLTAEIAVLGVGITACFWNGWPFRDPVLHHGWGFLLALLTLVLISRILQKTEHVKIGILDAKEEEMHSKREVQIDWARKIRIYVGAADLAVFGGKGGHLQEILDTPSFRDALFEYANKFWKEQSVHSSRDAPSQEMVLEMVDYGDVETRDQDGKVHVTKQKVPMFIPKETNHLFSASRLRSVRAAKSSSWLTLAWLRSWGWSSDRTWTSGSVQQQPQTEAAPERYAPLTMTGDIQIGISMHQAGSRVSLHSAGSSGSEFEKLEGDSDRSSPGGAQPEVFLDVYGEDAFKKTNDLIQGVLSASVNRPKPQKLAEDEYKQLYWYTLCDWATDVCRGGRSKPVPIFRKTPIYGDRAYHMHYHESFFHPKKNQLLGTSTSLLDQFQDRTGNYAVPGAQQKLNFLLHGPPGTGKSKFARTAAMYLRRHVVSFSLSQIETEIQFITLLEDLSSITDVRWSDDEFTYSDLLYVIEEIDTDPRGICLQRSKSELPMGPVSPASDAKQEEEPASRNSSGDRQMATPLSLGLILRTLDGSSETPGRIIMMTTNREELLDEAFKRPGRMKKVQMKNLTFPEFKKMILHFRRFEGWVPTLHLWTCSVDRMARMVMEDFLVMQGKRIGDLDQRSLGLSPALLEELCMEAQSLHKLFELMIDELLTQRAKLSLDQDPPSLQAVRTFEWRMNTLRQTVLFYIKEKNPEKHEAACQCWPEVSSQMTEGDASQNGSSEKGVAELVRCMIQDEEVFNEAIELCTQDYGHLHEDFQYRLQIELALSRLESNTAVDLDSALDMLMLELEQKWERAWNTKDTELRILLNDSELPPCKVLFTRWRKGRARS